MQKEINTPVFVAIIAVVIIAVGLFAWHKFGSSGGQLTAAQAGLGKPMHPGEIPGQTAPVNAPMTGPGTH